MDDPAAATSQTKSKAVPAKLKSLRSFAQRELAKTTINIGLAFGRHIELKKAKGLKLTLPLLLLPLPAPPRCLPAPLHPLQGIKRLEGPSLASLNSL